MKTMLIIFFLTVATGAPFAARADEWIFPHQSALEMRRVAPTTRPWYEPDDSLQSVNAGYGGGSAEKMIRIMGDGLIGEYGWLALHRRPAAEVLDALCRSGGHPHITNILHVALLAPTNHYRDATFCAYVMASPVPMTVLAETIVKKIPEKQRFKWYADARARSFDPFSPWDPRLIERPSRAALRFAHFRFMAKQIETDPECLRVLDNPVDPERE